VTSRARFVVLLAMSASVLLAPLVRPAGAAPKVQITAASIGGRSLFGDTRGSPVPMKTKHQVPFSVTVRNNGAAPVVIRFLSINGSIISVRLVRFSSTVGQTVPPFSAITINQLGDFASLDGAATGYFDASIAVADAQGNTIASHGFGADSQGGFWSTEGIALLLVVAFAVVGIVRITIGVSRRSLSRNRFVRGLTFAITAAAGAIAIVVALAMFRIDLLPAAAYVPAIFLATAIGFGLGFVSPGPLERRARDVSEDRVVDIVAAEAVARASGEYSRRTTGGTVLPHESGDYTQEVAKAGHDSGSFTKQDSGSFTKQDSGSFTPQHESGEFAPQGDTESS
jgi:hypothetical protein